MFIVGRMNPPTPGHVDGLVIPFLHKVREQAIRMLSCKDCLSDEDNRWCVPGEQLPGHCFKDDEIAKTTFKEIEDETGKMELKEVRPNLSPNSLGTRARACSDGRTIVRNPDACGEPVSIKGMSFDDLIIKANLRAKIYLTNTTNQSRINRPWQEESVRNIAEKIKNDGVNELVDPKPAIEGVLNNYYVKYFLLENPLSPAEKKEILTEMVRKRITDVSANANISSISETMLNNIIVTDPNTAEGEFCGNQGIKSAVECAQYLQKVPVDDDEQEHMLDPRHIILVMGSEEDASEKRRREKFCITGEIKNDETTKIRCESLKRISIGDSADEEDEEEDEDGDPIQFSDESMSASKIRLMVSKGEVENIRTIYNGYLKEESINKMIGFIERGVFLNRSPLLPPPDEISASAMDRRTSARQVEKDFPLPWRKPTLKGLLDDTWKARRAGWTGARKFGNPYYHDKLGLGELATQEIQDNFDAEQEGEKEEEDTNKEGGRRRKKTRRKGRKKKKAQPKKKKKTLKRKKTKKKKQTKRKKNMYRRKKTRRVQIGCSNKTRKR